MSSSTIPATSRQLPATSAGPALSANEWLRVGLVGGVVAGLVASVFGYLLAEPALGRAVDLESGGHAHMTMTPEVFTRSEQHAGFVLGELMFAAGVGFLLAGAAYFLSRPGSWPARLWVGMTAACIWAAVVLPAFAFPPLPPGVEATMSIGWRQAGYVLTIAVGLLGCLLAARLPDRIAGWRRALVAGACLGVPAAALLLALPDQGAAGAPPGSLLTDFRLASWGTQAVFWIAFAAAGWLQLRRRGVVATTPFPEN